MSQQSLNSPYENQFFADYLNREHPVACKYTPTGFQPVATQTRRCREQAHSPRDSDESSCSRDFSR